MKAWPDDLSRRMARIAADRESGASELLIEVLDLLRAARAGAVPLAPLARAICQAQPSMAPVWNASLEALASSADPDRFERFAQRVARSPGALARFAAECLAADGESRPLRLVTISCSSAVAVVVEAVRRRRLLRVACSESRPALEGRRCASRLAATGVPVTLFGDAAIGHALAAADAVVLGADAIGPEWFLNKSGSRMLAAAAGQQGVPVYVAATRDKFVSHALGLRLQIREGAREEIWDAPPEGVEIRNPYFESTPLDLVTAVISDAGVLGAGMIPEVCDSMSDPALVEALEMLGEW